MTLEAINMLQTAADGSFLDLFTMMPCVGYLLVALAKALKIKMNRSVFENLVSELRDMWPHGQIPQDEHEVLSTALNQLKLLVRAYFSCNMMLGSIFILPVLFVYIKSWLGYDVQFILPFGYWLPFDPYQDIKYLFEIVFFVMTCHCFLSALSMMAGDLLFIVCLSHITTQFALLLVRIDKLFHVPIDDQLVETYPLGMYLPFTKNKQQLEIENNPSSIDDNDRDKRIEEELVFIIERHRALIRLSSDIENMYTFSLLVNFMNSSVIICFCLFCVAFVEKWNEFIYKIFFTTAISQTFILCWYGQRLMDTSTGVGEALYNCGWYTATHKTKKSILIMIHRAQKEVHITTYGFSVISLASYATILRTSWSYFTLLINMYKE
ncbi:odorant receptor 67c-like [Bicyclus anynana]|uniref:Odorant receptor n=1 Tax=Bicyclus anynana TaxID=110368 RepID=A0ABM3M1W4_BICAN|nr:odorant receptor 67c-like [Bicyclus anynana]